MANGNTSKIKDWVTIFVGTIGILSIVVQAIWVARDKIDEARDGGLSTPRFVIANSLSDSLQARLREEFQSKESAAMARELLAARVAASIKDELAKDLEVRDRRILEELRSIQSQIRALENDRGK